MLLQLLRLTALKRVLPLAQIAQPFLVDLLAEEHSCVLGRRVGHGLVQPGTLVSLHLLLVSISVLLWWCCAGWI